MSFLSSFKKLYLLNLMLIKKHMTTRTSLIKGSTIEKEFSEFEKFFHAVLQSDDPVLSPILEYILQKNGKHMRPMFILLSAKIFGEISKKTYTAASSIEIMHTASLIHDDVVDESEKRRGSFSVNAIWKNKAAVLVGDFLMSVGLSINMEGPYIKFIDLLTNAFKQMSEGEIIQLSKSRELDIDFDSYFDIIYKKTAVLFATSLAIGAASVTEDQKIIDNMYDIGKNIGIAFQIKDDIFDYSIHQDIGKPTGNDLKEKKITLPMLYILDISTEAEKKKIKNIIAQENQNEEKIQELISLVIEKGGLDYATEQMNKYKNQAISQINSLPDSPSKTDMIKLVEYVTNRKK